ncbi:hemerythrin domain-containing protein [Thermasporomyces composti]|jgi:hemerythrin-like domain-containing protein|uniref:Hemerythrin HHE cation binding domain-containing protein n=1 Tax=Thermasporomyces composti TaxID=696763 RepID=A0A3D9VKF2_THECX|nr:hemerythrin domain-containing protein [Thermasporomyces composti]REF37841.1 hemerythrin HHE cation binding domain-containing protein [Thermasporomyces composti]
MCEYCGCRQVEPIAQLMDEHFALLDLGGAIRRALRDKGGGAATELLQEFRELLHRHVRLEERGVFAAMKAEGEFVDQVLELEQEHDDLEQALAELDLTDGNVVEVVDRLLAELSEHIDRENLGIFPVAVVSLGATGWEIVTRAHEEQQAAAS